MTLTGFRVPGNATVLDGWIHWGELNSRPSHYQWDAIPLSHSGSARAISGLDLTTAD